MYLAKTNETSYCQRPYVSNIEASPRTIKVTYTATYHHQQKNLYFRKKYISNNIFILNDIIFF